MARAQLRNRPQPGPIFGITAWMDDPNLLGRDFAGPSWDSWKVTLKGAFGEPMTAAEVARFRELAQRDPPKRRIREAWFAVGRRGGKDSIAAAVACYVAACGDFQRHLRRGERATIVCLAVDRVQAGIVFGYVKATFESTPLLAELLVSARDDTVKLNNGVEIVVATNNFRGIRGRTVAVAILDEIAFWRDESFANPDVEVYSALQKGMITLRAAGTMIIGISTVYRKDGLLYQKVSKHLGQPDDDVLAILAPSVTYNPLLAEPDAAAEIAQQLIDDPERAAAEWLSVWRADLSDLFDRETVQAAIDKGVTVRFPRAGVRYTAAVDVSGGRGDAFTAAVGHAEGNLLIVDAIYERRAPFVSDVAMDEVAAVAHDYGAHTVFGDNYGADLTVSAFRGRGIAYKPITVHDKGNEIKLNRSAIYLNSLPLFTAGRVRLPDHPRLFHELISLERRAARSGHDSVDHPKGQHDDIANSVCACLVMLAGGKQRMVVSKAAVRTSQGLGMSAGRFSPETLSMAQLAGIPVDVDAGPDGRRRSVSQTALAVSRYGHMTPPRPSYGDPNRGSIDMHALAQMRFGRR
jgi:hypothetical protein